VTIVGEPGLGKSRLVEAMDGEAAIDGAVVVTLAGSSDHRGVGFHPLRRLIETRCRIGAGSSTNDQLIRLQQELTDLGFALQDVVPLLAPILGLDPDAGYTEAAADGRKLNDDIAKAAAEYVLACLGQGPALLVVEDHHTMDDSTDDLISRIVHSGRAQTLVVATSRTVPVEDTESITLGPISKDACVALVDAIAPPATPAALDRGRLVERSDGVPLFLEELVRGSGLDPVDIRHRPARSAASTVPDVLYEPLMARLYTSTATVAVAATAATIGRDLDVELLEQSVDLPDDAAAEAVNQLVDALIFERIAGEPGRLRFRHELVREVAYDLLSPSRRREVHARVADALIESVEQDERSDWTLIANHFERSDRPLDAAKAWREAAEDARRRGLGGEARLRLGLAIDQVVQLPPGPERNQLEVELLLQRGYLASSAEGMSSPDATRDYERCLQLTLDVRHAPTMVSALTAMWGYYTWRADLARARRVSTTLQSLVSDEWGAFWRPQNAASFAMIDLLEGDFVQADAQLRAAVGSLYERENVDREAVEAWFLPSHPTVAMHVQLAIARFMAGDLVGAEQQGRRAMEICEDLPFPRGPWSAAYARWYLAWLAMEKGDLEGSFALIQEMSTIGEQHGYDVWSLVAMTQHAASTAARDIGNLDEASTGPGQAILGSLIGAWKAIDLSAFLPIYVTMLGRLAAKGGDVDRARTHYEESLRLAESTGMHFYDAETRRGLAHLADQTDEIVRGLGEALALARAQGSRPFELRVALDLHAIRGEAAAAELRAAVDGFAPDASYPELDDARARLARLNR
jgi:tetratricopeptide (TPR) repeat protein